MKDIEVDYSSLLSQAYPLFVCQSLSILQEILDKFEFLPIRCRIQRAAEKFNKSFNQRTSEELREFYPTDLPTKVF